MYKNIVMYNEMFVTHNAVGNFEIKSILTSLLIYLPTFDPRAFGDFTSFRTRSRERPAIKMSRQLLGPVIRDIR